MGGLIVNKRKCIVYLHDGSTIHGNRAIISTQHGSMGENAVFSVECTAGYHAVVVKQTSRKCAAFDFMRFSRITLRPTICYQSIENAIFNDAIFIDNAAVHCIQRADFIDGVGKSEVVGFSAGQIQCAMAHAIGCFINIPAVTIIVIITTAAVIGSVIIYNWSAIIGHLKW